MAKHIVLIAPRGIHLARIAEGLAKTLDLALYSPNDFSDEDWKALGYNYKREVWAFAKGGAYAAYQDKVPMRIAAIKKLLAHPSPSIIFFEPDFVVYEDTSVLAQVKEVLQASAKVILLCPSIDVEENARLLDADLAKMTNWSEVNAYWVKHPSNENLAKQCVYTANKTEQETCAEILSLAEKDSDIILIGPKLTGKTTIGFLLSEALNVPQVSLDNVGWDYLGESDFDADLARQIYREGGIFPLLDYRRKVEAHMVERTLTEHKNCVIDFGGGHSVYDEGEYFNKVATLLAPYPNVFLILPSADKDELIRILDERWQMDSASERKLQRLLVTHPSFNALAQNTVFTHEKDEVDIMDELKQLL